MTGDIAAVTAGRIIDSGSRRISVNVLNYDIGRFARFARFKKVKMDVGPVGKAVVANSAITRMPALRVSTFSIRPDGPGKCFAIRRKVMA